MFFKYKYIYIYNIHCTYFFSCSLWLLPRWSNDLTHQAATRLSKADKSYHWLTSSVSNWANLSPGVIGLRSPHHSSTATATNLCEDLIENNVSFFLNDLAGEPSNVIPLQSKTSECAPYTLYPTLWAWSDANLIYHCSILLLSFCPVFFGFRPFPQLVVSF